MCAKYCPRVLICCWYSSNKQYAKILDNIPHIKGVIATRVKHKCTGKLKVFITAGGGHWRCSRISPVCAYCLLTVEGWSRRVKIGAKCVKNVWLSCPARPSRWVLCISMQWLRLKAYHVACDECASGEICSLQHMWVTGSVMWVVASRATASLKFGVQGASATNWFSRVNGARDNGIRLYVEIS